MPARRSRDYVALLKPRVMSLVVFTGLVGLLIAPGHLHPVLAFIAVLCIAVGAGASRRDQHVVRPRHRRGDAAHRATGRSRPAGSSPARRSGFGVVLAVGSVMRDGAGGRTAAAAALLALSIAFYVFVYTMWLKRRTPQNIVIGGAAGAFPPVIGWAAVTGDVGCCRSLLFAIIFFWTPPHFWALSLYRQRRLRSAPACRCCRSSPGRARPGGRCCSTRWCCCR